MDTKNKKRLELAWAAGFYDGEGCLTCAQCCPKCGVSEGEPVNSVADPRSMYSVSLGYCEGSQEPETDCGNHKHQNVCAGLNTEHLHVQCDNCKYVWLMQVKP